MYIRSWRHFVVKYDNSYQPRIHLQSAPFTTEATKKLPPVRPGKRTKAMVDAKRHTEANTKNCSFTSLGGGKLRHKKRLLFWVTCYYRANTYTYGIHIGRDLQTGTHSANVREYPSKKERWESYGEFISTIQDKESPLQTAILFIFQWINTSPRD